MEGAQGRPRRLQAARGTCNICLEQRVLNNDRVCAKCWREEERDACRAIELAPDQLTSSQRSLDLGDGAAGEQQAGGTESPTSSKCDESSGQEDGEDVGANAVEVVGPVPTGTSPHLHPMGRAHVRWCGVAWCGVA